MNWTQFGSAADSWTHKTNTQRRIARATILLSTHRGLSARLARRTAWHGKIPMEAGVDRSARLLRKHCRKDMGCRILPIMVIILRFSKDKVRPRLREK